MPFNSKLARCLHWLSCTGFYRLVPYSLQQSWAPTFLECSTRGGCSLGNPKSPLPSNLPVLLHWPAAGHSSANTICSPIKNGQDYRKGRTKNTGQVKLLKRQLLCQALNPCSPHCVYICEGVHTAVSHRSNICMAACPWFFLFNPWLDSVGAYFPVKPEKEGLLCASVFAFVLFLSLLLSYIKKLNNPWLLLNAWCLSDSVCWDIKGYLSAMAIMLHACLFVSVTSLKGSTCGIFRIFFWLGSFWNDNSPKSLLPYIVAWLQNIRELKISFVTLYVNNRNSTKWNWEKLLKVILPFQQPPDRISRAEDAGDEIVISPYAKSFWQQHFHTENYPRSAQASQLENVS